MRLKTFNALKGIIRRSALIAVAAGPLIGLVRLKHSPMDGVWRAMKRRQIAYLGLVGFICLVSSTSAAAVTAAPASTLDSDVAEHGFKLQGSHGFSIFVAAYSEEDGRIGRIYITASRKDESAFYEAPAKVTIDSIQADLGKLGRIDVVRRPLGGEKTVHPKCFGGAQTYEPATLEGLIEFNGEEGYTRARESRVAQLPAWLMFVSHGPCGSGYAEATGPGEPGARLRGVSFAHSRSLSFQVNKNSPRAPMVFTAWLKERRDGIRISRELAGTEPSSAFHFNPSLRTASLSPGVPFSGSASLTRSRNSFSPIWTGDLSLDFPGNAGVPLAGPGVHVSLVHARFKRSRGPNAGIGWRPGLRRPWIRDCRSAACRSSVHPV